MRVRFLILEIVEDMVKYSRLLFRYSFCYVFSSYTLDNH